MTNEKSRRGRLFSWEYEILQILGHRQHILGYRQKKEPSKIPCMAF